MAVVDLLTEARRLDADWENLVLVTRGTSYTWGGLEWTVQERAGQLADRGATRGTIFPFEAEADEDGILDLLTLWHMGITPAPLNPNLTEVERTRARRVLEGVEPEGAQVVLWTSGTSGLPRGVALSWSSLLAVHDASRRRLGSDHTDHWLASLSPAHVGGLSLIVRALLLDGQLVAYGRLTTEELSDLVDSSEPLPGGVNVPVDSVSLVPTQLHRLLEHRGDRPAPSTMKRVLVGGAHAPSSLLSRALDLGWPVALTYGMTEMSSQVATAPPDVVRRKPGTVGQPLAGVQLRIADDGEILLKGETRALLYVGSDEPMADKDGWYHTGDLGHRDADGDLWITGRRSDRIVSGGVNVDALEVEEALRGHPAVVDACVGGIPDEEWGEVVAAWVVPVEGEFDLDEVAEWVAGRLAPAKRPRRWVVDRELPLYANGKVDRALIASLMNEA